MIRSLNTIRAALGAHGIHGLTSEMLKQAGEPYPLTWNLKTAALAITLKMAQNRATENTIRQGLLSYQKVTR